MMFSFLQTAGLLTQVVDWFFFTLEPYSGGPLTGYALRWPYPARNVMYCGWN